jgi:hypothetical protein
MLYRLSIIARGRVVLDLDIPRPDPDKSELDGLSRPLPWEHISACDTLITAALHQVLEKLKPRSEERLEIRVGLWDESP